ncbi:MAG: hypothetical protein IKR05_08365 [Prevotella sp.]|nr:hypothetical protein [Prevotella sp.]
MVSSLLPHADVCRLIFIQTDLSVLFAGVRVQPSLPLPILQPRVVQPLLAVCGAVKDLCGLP